MWKVLENAASHTNRKTPFTYCAIVEEEAQSEIYYTSSFAISPSFHLQISILPPRALPHIIPSKIRQAFISLNVSSGLAHVFNILGRYMGWPCSDCSSQFARGYATHLLGDAM